MTGKEITKVENRFLLLNTSFLCLRREKCILAIQRALKSKGLKGSHGVKKKNHRFSSFSRRSFVASFFNPQTKTKIQSNLYITATLGT